MRSMRQTDIRGWEKREELLLAPYAMFAKNSEGRRYAEPRMLIAVPFSATVIVSCTARPFVG